MQKVTKYTIFKTKWGHFGLAGNENGLLQTCLPLNNPEKVKSRLLVISETLQFEKWFYKTIQEQIIAYFEGACVTFSTEFSHQDTKSQRNQIYKEKTSSLGAFVAKNADIPIVLVRKDSIGDGLSDFCSSVLTACRDIKFGEVVTYSALTKKLGRPNAARAVGNALSKNPLPLIIPCHRVVRSDGKIGGFSAAGGMNTKAKLLKHEQLVLRSDPSSAVALLQRVEEAPPLRRVAQVLMHCKSD